MKTTTLLLFQGQPILPKELSFSRADFLRNAFGQAVLKEFKDRVRTDYQNNKNIDVLFYDEKDHIVKGSNPYAIMLVNAIVEQEGHRTASQADLEQILLHHTLRLYIEQSALVLRPKDKSYIAQHLRRQVQARQKIDGPVMINLHDFTAPRTDTQSPDGLVCQLKEHAQLIPAPQLADENHLRKFSQTDVFGLPIFDEQGSRTLYTSPHLSGVGLVMGDLHSTYKLSLSTCDLQVVVVSSANFQDYIDQLWIQKVQYEQTVQKALTLLQGVKDKSILEIKQKRK